MDWFWQLRQSLPDAYPADGPQNIVGYLKGTGNLRVWRSMSQAGRDQMVILGSVPPTNEQWAAAGVAARTDVQTILFEDIGSFIVTYGGFMVDRPWGKLSLSVEALRNYGLTISQFKANLPKQGGKKSAAVVAALSGAIDRITREMDRASGEHKAQQGLTTGAAGNFSGFFGYWTNHLFNKDVPPLAIWNECFGELAHARSTLKEGKLGESGKAIVRARAALLEAIGIYYRWKDGIQGAGTKMQVAIGAVAVTLIFAAVAATVATAAAATTAAAGATEGASAAATVDGVTATIARADALMTQTATTAAGGVTASTAAAYEQALAAAEEQTEELLAAVMKGG